MKIISVRFLNLNSLQGEHLIRFDEPPLSESGLFAITGPTGAGKTTILDAITVALYGEVPRHGSGKPIREIMTRHTGECRSSVEFVAHDTCYRATWSLRRSRGKVTGEFQAVHMELCLVADDKPFDLKPSEVPRKVAEIVGLDFQQFLRSVMLSQGDFTRFLKANESERSELLEKLTDTRIYSEISRAAHEKARDEKQKLFDLERHLQVDQLLPEAERSALGLQIAQLKANAQETTRRIQLHQQEQTWLVNLQKLAHKEAAYTDQLATAQADQEAWQPQQEKLHRHEQVQPFQSGLARLAEVQRQGQQVAQAVGVLQEKIPVQEKLVQTQTEAAQRARMAHAATQAELTEAEPKLDEVLQQDTRLQAQQAQFAKDEQAVNLLQGQVHQLNQIKTQQQAGFDNIHKEGISLKEWLAEHAQDEELSQTLYEGKAEWKSLEEVQRQQAKLKKDQADYGLLLETEAKNTSSRQAELEEVSQKLKAQQAGLADLQAQSEAALQGQKPEALEQLCHRLPQVCSQLERQLDLSKNHLHLEKRRQELQTQLAETTQNLHRQRTTLTQTQTERQQALDKLQDVQQIVDLQRQIQEYEEARAQLQPEQPCPLCGSLHHPFVEEHRPQGLSQAEKNLQYQKQRVQELETQEREMAAAANKLELAEQHTQNQLQDLGQQTETLHSTFSQLNDALELVHEIAASDTIDRYWNARKTELQHATATLEKLRSLRTSHEKARHLEQQLLTDQQRLRHEIEKIAQKRGQADVQMQRLQADLDDLAEQEKVLARTLHSFFGTYGLSFSGANGSTLLPQLEKRKTKYEQKNAQLLELREKYSVAKGEVESTRKALTEKKAELTERQAHLQMAQTQLQELQAQRYALLPKGLQPQAEKQRLQQTLQIAAQTLQAAENALQREQEKLNLFKHQLTAQANEQKANQELQKAQKADLLQKIQPLGLTSLAELTVLLLPEAEARQLRQEQESRQKAVTELTHSLQQTRTEYQTEKERHLTELTLEELQPLIQMLEEEKNLFVTQAAQLDMQLQQETDLREKHRQLTEQLDVQKGETERWDRLARLIGSADGKKFSKYAQSLTLARLVELGNRHLHRLNDRYRILKSQENELELQILDTYQGDAVRSVNSLSGGESFLVSLALALGLSDLASHKAQIHSLFIDEGFGTLDAETLDVAMDALESLQASGKMIGIISHVEALKERISTQIVVEKQAAGRSSIRVASSNPVMV